jgi:hypothetical protein
VAAPSVIGGLSKADIYSGVAKMNRKFVAAIATYCGLLSQAAASTYKVDCDASESIQGKVAMAKAGDTILLTGMCTQSVRIPADVVGITLDGQSKAIIRVTGTKEDAIFVFGKDITIKGFTLTGGRDGIHLSGQAAGASAIIDSNVIRQTGRYGIHVDKGSYATIVNNTIENVPSTGIDITENSFARIGFRLPSAPNPYPNTIQNNGGHGISVTRISGAWVAYNTLMNNKGSGIFINRNSQIDVVDNLIGGNGGDAITASQNAGVNLRSEDTDFPAKPNRTELAAPNASLAIRCSTSWYVEGPLGTLLGREGLKDFDNSCVDRTIP